MPRLHSPACVLACCCTCSCLHRYHTCARGPAKLGHFVRLHRGRPSLPRRDGRLVNACEPPKTPFPVVRATRETGLQVARLCFSFPSLALEGPSCLDWIRTSRKQARNTPGHVFRQQLPVRKGFCTSLPPSRHDIYMRRSSPVQQPAGVQCALVCRADPDKEHREREHMPPYVHLQNIHESLQPRKSRRESPRFGRGKQQLGKQPRETETDRRAVQWKRNRRAVERLW